MVLTLYYMAGSAPCSQVLLTARALGLELELKHLDLMAKEQLAPEFVKLNPQHTVPTLVDGEFSVWESRAISRYLVNKYGADSALYPAEPQARALVDQRLDFDLGTLYRAFAEYFYPQFLEGQPADEVKLQKLQDVLGFLELFLQQAKFVAGPELTIADIAIVASISLMDAVGVDLTPHANIIRWFDLMKSTAVGYEEAIGKNVKILINIVDKMIHKKDASF